MNSPEQDTKTRILAIAQALFSEKGFDGTGIDEIAKKTGIAKSVIYYHFKNKHSILEEITQRFINESLQFRNDRLIDITNGNYNQIIDDLLDFLLDRKDMIKIIFVQSVKLSKDVPLFHLLDVFFCNVNNGVSNISQNDLDDMKIQEFYLFYLPLVNFAIFQDKWCETNKLQREEAKKRFAGILSQLVKEVYTPVLCR